MTPLELAIQVRALRVVKPVSEAAALSLLAREKQEIGRLASTPARRWDDVLAKLDVLERLIEAGDFPAHQLALCMSTRRDVVVLAAAAHVDTTEAGTDHGTPAGDEA